MISAAADLNQPMFYHDRSFPSPIAGMREAYRGSQPNGSD
jgi:hypothetical protein